jgi:hypothetical protein
VTTVADEETPQKKIEWTTMLTPEELAAARERLGRIKHEFTVVYGLKWTEDTMTSEHRRARVSFEDIHAEACDYGPLSYWRIERASPGGAREGVDGGDSIAYEVAKIEAMEAMLRLLDARAKVAAEALKDPEPILGGATGPTGATGRTGPVSPVPTGPMTTPGAGPVPVPRGATGSTQPTWPASPWALATVSHPVLPDGDDDE